MLYLAAPMIVIAIFLQVASGAQRQPLVLEHLELDAPAGYSLEKRPGPDFAVYYHLFIDADSESTLKEAQAMAATLRPTANKARRRSGASVLPNKWMLMTRPS
jgi:hypothetical protein